MRISKTHWLLNLPVAHRGLWNAEIPENSKEAFINATKYGYPVEIDLYLTKDEEIVCFHDKTLARMTGESGFVYDKTLAELKQLKLNGTDSTIVTLDEVLKICNGKSPLLIEFKDQPSKNFVELAVKKLKGYTGEFAVQSFNPLYLKKIKKLAPEFLRGVLGSAYAPEESKLVQFIIKKMPLNFLIKPDFISYRYDDLPLKKRKRKNLPVLAWTVTDQKTYEKVKPHSDNIIFEHFIPEK